jgi:hypothetical protein
VTKTFLIRGTAGALIAILLIIAVRWTGREFLAHAKTIIVYLADPASPKVSPDEELNYHLTRYVTSSYSINLVDNAELSLSPATRRNTIQQLGSFGLRDQTDFEEGGKLSDAVNSYLIDRLTLLGYGLSEKQKPDWARLVDNISGSLGRRSVNDYIEARDRAESFLGKQKLPDQVLKAHRLFETYEIGPHPSDLTFFVGSDPDPETFPTLIASATSESLQATNRRQFHLYTVGGDRDLGQVQASLTKVFCDIRFIRHWLPENLLDDGIELPSDMATRHFGTAGSLRIVPVVMVVFVGLDVTFEINDVTASDVGAAIETNRCCELRSSDLSLRLASSSIRKVGELKYRGRTESDDPRLVAVVSRRRVPK